VSTPRVEWAPDGAQLVACVSSRARIHDDRGAFVRDVTAKPCLDARWTVVEVEDTLWLDPAVPDIAALAFDPDGRRIACLASDGTIDVVPVP
jgi:hypothetical protein